MTGEIDEARSLIRRCEDKALLKEALKEAAKEWMTEQFASFGKWTALGMAAGIFGLLIKILVVNNFWPKGG